MRHVESISREIPAMQRVRSLGTMIVYGFPRGDVAIDLAIAARLNAKVVEVLPDWRRYPDPSQLRQQVEALGLRVHSAHGCWGGQAIRAWRVDLGEPDVRVRAESLDDLKRCLDWLSAACGQCLIVHPGGLSEPEKEVERTAMLAENLNLLADHAAGLNLRVCVENMPPGVYPGSRMASLAELLCRVDRPELALAIDTGHAQLNASAASETRAAGAYLRSTHVHDNDGLHDAHLPPGLGTVDWRGWVEALDAIDYDGPIMLECIRALREHPERINDALAQLLDQLTRRGPCGEGEPT